MINRDDIMERKDEFLARKDELLARKDELRLRFVEKVDDPIVDGAIAMSLVGAGVGTIIANLIRGKRSVWSYLLPAAFVLGGVAVLGGGAFSRRSTRIGAAEETVRAELSRLDPLARARILKDMASEAMMPFMRHAHD